MIDFLFNTSDSSLCFFGGNIHDFSAIMINYLGDNFTTDNIMKSLMFYVNTASFDLSFHLVNNYEEVMDLIQKVPHFNDLGFPKQRLLNATEKAKPSIKPLKIEQNDSTYVISFYTWSLWYVLWGCDFWEFRVAKDSIEIINREKVINASR